MVVYHILISPFQAYQLLEDEHTSNNKQVPRNALPAVSQILVGCSIDMVYAHCFDMLHIICYRGIRMEDPWCYLMHKTSKICTESM